MSFLRGNSNGLLRLGNRDSERPKVQRAASRAQLATEIIFNNVEIPRSGSRFDVHQVAEIAAMTLQSSSRFRSQVTAKAEFLRHF